MSWLVVGIDPGPTPGIVALASGLPPAVIQADRRSALFIVTTLVDGAFNCDRIVLAVEKFVLGPRASRSRTPQAGAETRELIATLNDRLSGHVSEFVERPAGAVKPWATDERLRAAGLLDATKGMTHARDAARIALFAAVHAGLMADPLSKASR